MACTNNMLTSSTYSSTPQEIRPQRFPADIAYLGKLISKHDVRVADANFRVKDFSSFSGHCHEFFGAERSAVVVQRGGHVADDQVGRYRMVAFGDVCGRHVYGFAWTLISQENGLAKLT